MNMDTYNTAVHNGIRDALSEHGRYAPGVPADEQHADTLDGYAAGWHCGELIYRTHNTHITADGRHGYPYRAHCACGWQSNTYASPHAADNMATGHKLDAAKLMYEQL